MDVMEVKGIPFTIGWVGVMNKGPIQILENRSSLPCSVAMRYSYGQTRVLP